jgi:hypothetical protein
MQSPHKEPLLLASPLRKMGQIDTTSPLQTIAPELNRATEKLLETEG